MGVKYESKKRSATDAINILVIVMSFTRESDFRYLWYVKLNEVFMYAI